MMLSSCLADEIRLLFSKNKKIKASCFQNSSAAYLLTQLLAKNSNELKKDTYKYVLICPNEEQAGLLYQNIHGLWQLFGDKKADTVNHKVDFFPGWEHSPYRKLTPSLKNRINRIKTIYKVTQDQTQLIITYPSAIAQKIPDRKSIEDRSFKLAIGDFYSREELSDKLRLAGYFQSEPVEDPGQFGFRGNLLDVFSPLLKKPIRIEFFGDEIEKIRCFDPQTQRSFSEEMIDASIVAVTDYSIKIGSETASEAFERLKKNIKNFCDHSDISKKERDTLVERIETFPRDPYFDYFLPFANDFKSESFLSYLLQEKNNIARWKLVVLDQFGVDSNFLSLFETLEQDQQKAHDEKTILPHWRDLYIGKDEYLKLKDLFELELNTLESPQDNLTAAFHYNTDIQKLAGHSPAFDVLKERFQANISSETAPVQLLAVSSKSQAERAKYILDQRKIPSTLLPAADPNIKDKIQIVEALVDKGFLNKMDQLDIVTDSELFGTKTSKTRKGDASGSTATKSDLKAFLSTLEELETNDLVVHKSHGVGKYKGLVNLVIEQIPQDFLLIEYSGNDKLYLPIYRLDQVQKYIGDADTIGLDKLGSQNFEKSKSRLKKELLEIATKLLEVQAQRVSRTGFQYLPPDEEYRKFEAAFPYVETSDQEKCIDDILKDMHSEKIMDRLVCGDVGYGKTEVAMRAAFLAVENKKQVAVLVPTTVLALQHERSFKERFKDAPVRIDSISRFKKAAEIKESLKDLSEGKIDIIIGTHRLLSNDVKFSNLGLLIIDEEQRFGVEHKEKIKNIKTATDVLTLTATPIPRTLHMSLMGIRDISVINTPPIDRLSVRTYVSRFDENIIQSAIRNELHRGGQVFFIHNRVQSIGAIADRIQKIVPEAKTIVAHGQLPERELEDRMLKFYNKEANVLVCSTIIESGLDIPAANTMIINRSDMFGLSQLYQLRGRVGRSQLRAYCYLLLPEEAPVSTDAQKRLEIIQRFADLGSGFKIAAHDLELRGTGNLLGKAQSGHIATVGYELFMELLDEAVLAQKGIVVEETFDPEIKVPVATLIPEAYIPDIHQRIGYYKKLSNSQSLDELEELKRELIDRYGEVPEPTENLVVLLSIKQLLAKFKIRSLTVSKVKILLDASQSTKLDPKKLIQLVQRLPKIYAALPDSRITIRKDFDGIGPLFQTISEFLSLIALPESA